MPMRRRRAPYRVSLRIVPRWRILSEKPKVLVREFEGIDEGGVSVYGGKDSGDDFASDGVHYTHHRLSFRPFPFVVFSYLGVVFLGAQRQREGSLI